MTFLSILFHSSRKIAPVSTQLCRQCRQWCGLVLSSGGGKDRPSTLTFPIRPWHSTAVRWILLLWTTPEGHSSVNISIHCRLKRSCVITLRADFTEVRGGGFGFSEPQSNDPCSLRHVTPKRFSQTNYTSFPDCVLTYLLGTATKPDMHPNTMRNSFPSITWQKNNHHLCFAGSFLDRKHVAPADEVKEKTR